MTTRIRKRSLFLLIIGAVLGWGAGVGEHVLFSQMTLGEAAVPASDELADAARSWLEVDTATELERRIAELEAAIDSYTEAREAFAADLGN